MIESSEPQFRQYGGIVPKNPKARRGVTPTSDGYKHHSDVGALNHVKVGKSLGARGLSHPRPDLNSKGHV
jgi:hypothetical protein